ncbi:Lrp/AsnC family transcriptional regulator [Streptomyces sp. NRRL F-5755]|uniref:Lrp/AsnC family transcriptional regulator n=1 Tax=Streptomyces sp. NRRL F-5755 TaxID=1519475 RepID=UPI00099C4231|nr:Lrp/AsnC family transcriptional regulator [Streptomyces sp. NRRL F-5755]
MAGKPHLDEVDVRLVEELRKDGRASFRSLAQHLDVSEQTASRRYHRLTADRILRVSVQPDPYAQGLLPLIVRVHTEGSTGRDVATQVARRADTPWVETLAGTTDVTFTTLTRPATEDSARLLDALARTRGIRESVPCMTLRIFTGPASWTGEGPPLDPYEQRLVAALVQDGRAPFEKLAEELGSTATTVRRRLEQLCERQALQFRTEIDLTLLGRPVETMMWLNVRTRSIEDIGTVLAADPRVRFCAATTGPYNLVLATHHPTAGDLYRMQTDTLGALQDIQRIEITPTVRVVKRHGILREGHLLRPPNGKTPPPPTPL